MSASRSPSRSGTVWLDPVGSAVRVESRCWVTRKMPAAMPTASAAAAAFTQPAAMTGFCTSVPLALSGSGPPLSTTTV